VLVGRWKGSEKKEAKNLQQRKIKVVISGGGTGGHIFPAIAIANALKNINSENEILFVGAKGKMEMEKIPASGYNIIGLPIIGIQRKFVLSNLLLPFKVVNSIIMSRRILKKFRPDVAIGVGGYASAPLLYASTMLRIPALIQEQNSYAGITNKLLAKRVMKICVAYSGMERYFPPEKIVLTGNPVRQDIHDNKLTKEDANKFFNLKNGGKTLLVIGGSLGARTINESLYNEIEKLVEQNIQVIWQTGKMFVTQAQRISKKFENKGIRTYDFITRMDLAYSTADVVISRAGALSISELAITGKPCILVPSPNVAEDHQTKNAMALVNKNAAILIKDKDAIQELVSRALELLMDDSKQKILAGNISQMAIKNSAEKIANEIYSLTI
jgi:UDP-N-acetylglucosamine--N-acetylmuramyl-(pentapeptide) pyrophosphoryl-undecaprenol N-acetylglucosamine transferase